MSHFYRLARDQRTLAGVEHAQNGNALAGVGRRLRSTRDRG
jgi:hypothetical protein